MLLIKSGNEKEQREKTHENYVFSRSTIILFFFLNSIVAWMKTTAAAAFLLIETENFRLQNQKDFIYWNLQNGCQRFRIFIYHFSAAHKCAGRNTYRIKDRGHRPFYITDCNLQGCKVRKLFYRNLEKQAAVTDRSDEKKTLNCAHFSQNGKMNWLNIEHVDSFEWLNVKSSKKFT